MHAGSDKCRRDGCAEPRTQYSVFCDEHHQEQLRNVGLIPDTSPDLSAVMRQRFERLLAAYERQAITKDEVCSNLFDCFIHAHTRGTNEHCIAGLDSLPIAVLDDLLAYANAHPEPRVFHPRSTDPERQTAEERSALAAQAHFIACLQEKSR